MVNIQHYTNHQKYHLILLVLLKYLNKIDKHHIKNLLVIKEFRPLVKYFSCGNWIRIKIDDTIYKLRLLEYNLDFDNLNNFGVTFSDVTYGVDGMTDTKSILDKAGSMATSYDSVKRQALQGADGNGRIQNWIYKGK